MYRLIIKDKTYLSKGNIIMKKEILLVSMMLMASTSAMAAKVGESGVGLEYGALKSNAVSRVNGVTADGDLSTTYEALRVGKYYDFGRIGATVGIMNKDQGTDGKFVGLNYDYMFYNEGKFIPFVGASLSYSKNQAKGTNYTIDHNGMQYGIEAGGVYELSDKVDLEVGARYLKSNVDGGTTVSGNVIAVEVDSVTQYYISLGYKF
jgi:hypothetical protein